MRQESGSIQRLREEMVKMNDVLKRCKRKPMNHFMIWGDWTISSHIANPMSSLLYLTKSLAQGVLVVTLNPPSSCLISDFRYEDQVKNDAQVLRYGICKGRVHPLKLLKQKKIIKSGDVIGIDSKLMSLIQAIEIVNLFPENDFEEWVGVIESLSVIKDEQEMVQEREAINLAEQVFQDRILPKIERKLSRGEKITTLDLAAIIASYGAKHCVDNSLSIILINEHSCHPHGKTGDPNWRSIIEQGDIIVFNWGYSVGGNCSDITRAVMIGKPKTDKQKEFEKAYKLMIRVKKALMAAIKDGVYGKEIWKIAQKMINESSFSRFDLDITGHGIGIQIHNYPLVSHDHLSAGQILSVEPGINLLGIAHARVGGQVLVAKDGCEDLSSLSEDLVII